MDKKNSKTLIKKFTDELNHHNYLYYQEDTSAISDYEFDQKLKELEKLEKQFPDFKLPYSPTSRVGGEITKTFKTVQHRHPMLSLGNTYSKAELLDFNKRVEKGLGTDDYEYICELKFDGVAISLSYENGILKTAVTRGDGLQGDDITTNAKTILSIPLHVQLPENTPNFEVRGEIFMSKPVFKELNENRKRDGEELLANPRNTTSGTLKMQNSKKVAHRKLDCYVYNYMDDQNTVSSHESAIKYLKKMGFKVSPTYKKCNTINDVFEYINLWDKKRHTLDIEIDGIVIKVNSLEQQAELGFTSKNPRWAISYKFKSESASTVIKGITYQVGRTGAITPVAELAPTLLSGTIVKRASLHNANEIARLNIRINDTVFVEKGGEIIPKITHVDLSKRSKDTQPMHYIEKCPECQNTLIKKDDEAQHYCPNQSQCPPQILGRIEHFISRDAMNISTLGFQTIKGFFNKKLIEDVSDLYHLTYENIKDLVLEETNEITNKTTKRSIKEKSAQNIIQSIEQSKKMPFERLLFGLGIRHVGKTVAEKLVEHFNTIEKIRNADIEEIIEVYEVGERIAHSVVEYFNNKHNQKMIESLKQSGLKMVKDITTKRSEKFKGKSFVISGTFDLYGREEIKNLIKNEGGKVSTSISSKTHYLVAGKNMGPSKKEKAKTLNITVIDEHSFKKILEQND